MKVLLTGAAGFLGRNLLLQAPADWEIVALYRGGEAFPGFVRGLANPRIAAVPCDLSDPAAVSRLCETHGAEWESCVYLAAKVDIPWSVREPNQDLLANVSPLLNLLERVRVAKLVYFSSGAVYDGCQGEATPSTPVRPTLPYPGLRELVGSLRRRGLEPIRWSSATDRRGPMSVLDIDGNCPPDLGEEIEDVIWSYLRPDDRMQWERIGVVRHPEHGEVRSEALALCQLLIVSHLVGALDGAFDL